MAKRRKASEALTEEEFIAQGDVKKKPTAAKAEAEVLVNGRVPSSIADRLNRAYADRRVSGEEPSKMKDILAAALDLWLTKNNY